MALKRRELLIGGGAAVAAPVIARAVRPLAIDGQVNALATARLIWCAKAVLVPLLPGGAAESIASSSKGMKQADTSDSHCVFAKAIDLPTLPSSAVLHLFAFTRYRLYVNGVYVGRGPCRYQNQRPEYDSRDVRSLLKAGRNTVAVLVHRDAPTGRIMRHEPGFIASLEMTLAGRRHIISTDTSWLSMPDLSFGARQQAWSSIEEHLDARKTADWAQPDLSSPIWQPSIVVAGSNEIKFFPRGIPLQLERERTCATGAPAIPVNLRAGNHIDLSLPEIAQAFHVLEMDAEAGSTLEVSYLLPGGDVNGTSTYLARSGTQTWIGGDTFAFRELRVRATSGNIRITRASVFEVRYPFERAASFKCSDPFLTQLWSICARSLELLSEDSYVDCADRERVEWTDDSPPAFDCTRVMMRGPDSDGSSHWGDSRLLRGLLRRIALTQQPDGQLKAHSCSERFDIHAIMEDRSCDWVVLLREYFESSGDKNLIEELWPTLLRLLDWFLDHRTDRGLVLEREWEVWDNPLRYQICEGTASNALVYRALQDASYLAGFIGRYADQQRFSLEGERLKATVNSLLWNSYAGAYDGAFFGTGAKTTRQFTGPIVDGHFQPTVQAQLFSLYCRIVPEDRVASVQRWVLSHLQDVKEPMSHYYLFRMLYEMEEPEQDGQVLRLIRSGWKKQVESPWQTSWEDLESDGSSKIHMYGIVPGSFLSEYALGVRRVGPVGDRSIVLEPRFGDLTYADGRTVTEFGPVDMKWVREADDTLRITCSIPPRLRTTLRLYRQGSNASMLIDGRHYHAQVSGNFIEAALEQGTHSIIYGTTS